MDIIRENTPMIRFPARVPTALFLGLTCLGLTCLGLTCLASTTAMVPTAPVGIQQATPQQVPGMEDISVVRRSLETSAMARYERSLPGVRKAYMDVDAVKGRMLRTKVALRRGEVIMEERAVLRAPRGRHHLLPSIAARACEEEPELKGVLMELVDCREDDRQGEEREAWFGRMFTNAHEVRATGEAGIFPFLAMINHSCEPNAGYITDASGSMVLRAKQDLGEGAEVTLSYIDIALPEPERNHKLESAYGFVCQCGRCKRERSEGSTDE